MRVLLENSYLPPTWRHQEASTDHRGANIVRAATFIEGGRVYLGSIQGKLCSRCLVLPPRGRQ